MYQPDVPFLFLLTSIIAHAMYSDMRSFVYFVMYKYILISFAIKSFVAVPAGRPYVRDDIYCHHTSKKPWQTGWALVVLQYHESLHCSAGTNYWLRRLTTQASKYYDPQEANYGLHGKKVVYGGDVCGCTTNINIFLLNLVPWSCFSIVQGSRKCEKMLDAWRLFCLLNLH